MAPKHDDYGKKLRRLRELAGMSQARLAQGINKDQSFISMVEAGYKRLTPEDMERAESFIREEMAADVERITRTLSDFAPMLATA